METIHLLKQIRSDFDRLRWQCKPITTQLIHKATNTEAEGLIGMPSPSEQPIAFGGAGHRDAYQRFDADGNPMFREDPILDVEGQPITNSAGEAFDVVMPAFRSVTFCGDIPDYQLLSNVAERAGRLLATMVDLPVLSFLKGWQFSTPDDLWYATLFEIAWAHRHPLLVAERRLWLPAQNPRTFLPYDLDQVRHLASAAFGPANSIPANWLKRLPEAWVSELKNTAAASFDTVDYLFTELQPPPEAVAIRAKNGGSVNRGDELENIAISEAASIAENRGSASASDHNSEVTMKRRFAVALSFPGEHRKLVEQVAHALSKALGETRIFYDKFHEVELACPNQDLRLQRFYAEDSDLVVVFVCGEYNEKDWCGIEWRAIRSLMKTRSRPDEDVMFLRLDDKPLEGLLPIDGYISISDKTSREVADFILKRWSAKR